jgi:hypothetical protein
MRPRGPGIEDEKMIRRTARVPWSCKDASVSDAGAILATVSAPSGSAVKGRLNLSDRVRVCVGCGDKAFDSEQRRGVYQREIVASSVLATLEIHDLTGAPIGETIRPSD